MLDMLSAVGPLMNLKKLGDNIKAVNVTPDDLLALAKSHDLNIDIEAAVNMAAKIPEFITNLDESLTQFVTGGGLIRMLVAQYTGTQEQTVGRCQHCDNLVFF